MEIETLRDRFFSKVNISTDPDSCWLWTAALNDAGYGVLGKGGGKHEGNIRATHVSLLLLKGEYVPKGMYACHHCDRPACVNPAHLYIGTPKQNRADAKKRHRAKGMFTKGQTCGEANVNTKLTAVIVLEARILYATGNYTFAELGRRYGVTYHTIARAIRGTVWSHV